MKRPIEVTTGVHFPERGPTPEARLLALLRTLQPWQRRQGNSFTAILEINRAIRHPLWQVTDSARPGLVVKFALNVIYLIA